jgi:hypothetical protein
MKLAIWNGFISFVLAASAVACGSSVPPPHDQYAAAEADIGRAQTGGAPNVPAARLHLQLAGEDLQQSKQAMDKDNSQSALLASMARSEAQLALALANESEARHRADATQVELQKTTGH